MTSANDLDFRQQRLERYYVKTLPHHRITLHPPTARPLAQPGSQGLRSADGGQSTLSQISPGRWLRTTSRLVVVEDPELAPRSLNKLTYLNGANSNTETRLYYIGNDDNIHELIFDGQEWEEDHSLDVSVYAGSSVAATLDSEVSNDVSIYYTAPDQNFSRLTSSSGNLPSSGSPILYSGITNSFSPTAPLAACSQPFTASNSTFNQTCTFRVDDTGIPIGVTYWPGPRSWEARSSYSWSKADNVAGGDGIAALCSWNNSEPHAQVWLYYPSGGVVQSEALNGYQWVDGDFRSDLN